MKPEEEITIPEGDAYSFELRGMLDHPFIHSEKYSEQQGRAKRALPAPDNRVAAPELLEFERKLIKRARKLGIPLFTHCVFRSAKEQDALFVQGRSKARAGQSPHNYGLAADIVHGTKGWDLTRKQWEIIGHIGKELATQAGIKITWGGDWNFYDPAHWELSNWKAIAAHQRATEGERLSGASKPQTPV